MNCLKYLICIVFSLAWMNADAQEEDVDSIEISLLTCSPHEEIYSLYGHTALRIHSLKARGEDVAVNWGMFSFGQGSLGMLEFCLRFMFGLTDYTIAIDSFDAFCHQYRYYGSSVTEQVLNLTADEKRRILAGIANNYQPENRVYRYNYFYDNCTTRAVDMIVNNLNAANGNTGRRLKSTVEDDRFPSFRDMIHSCNNHHPWAAFGNDILLGVGSDRPADKREWLFLPAHAMTDFGSTMIVDGQHEEPLVKQTNVVVEPGIQVVEKEFPLRPSDVFLVLLTLTVAITVIEKYSGKALWWYDALLMAISGLAGTILFLMLFSEQPTVRVNLQLLLLNPLPLFFIRRMIVRTKKKLNDRQYALWLLLICLFLIGSFWQHYAEGMMILASSLLIRNVWCYYRQQKYEIVSSLK